MSEVKKWYESDDGRILFLCGAPRVGKTWLAEELCREKNVRLAKMSVRDTDIPCKDKQDVLLIDKVDVAEDRERLRRLILRLRCEEGLNGVRLILEGSIVDKILITECFVDEEYVKTLQIFPMNFQEYRNQLGKHYDYSEYELMEMYFITGGLPECVEYFCDSGDFTGTRAIQNRILEEICSGKATKYMEILVTVPKQLKEDKSFSYRQIKDSARGREYGQALSELEKNGIIYKAEQLAEAVESDKLNKKVYIYDIGLMGAVLNIDERAIMERGTVLKLYDGLLLKVFIVQEIYSVGLVRHGALYYWYRERGKAKLPIVLDIDNIEGLFPVIISGGHWYAKSVNSFADEHDIKRLYVVETEPAENEGARRGHSRLKQGIDIIRIKPWNIRVTVKELIKIINWHTSW